MKNKGGKNWDYTEAHEDLQSLAFKLTTVCTTFPPLSCSHSFLKFMVLRTKLHNAT